MIKKAFEEHHLLRLLKDFDTTLALSYLQRVKAANDLAEDKGLSGALGTIEDGVLVDPVGFRLSLREPAFVLLSHPICRLRKKVPYPKQIEWERFFVAHLGMVPVYLVNLNVVTILKFWGFEESSQYVSKEFEQELDKGDMLLELSPSPRSAQYSSMNFVLPYGAHLNKAPDELLEPFQKYYQYLFWAKPSSGYTFSSQFLHRRAKITSFMNITKGLYTITSIGNFRQAFVENRSIDCRELTLAGVTVSDDEIQVVNGIHALVPMDVVEDLEKKDLKTCFLNAMLIELRSELGRINLLSNVVEIGESMFDLVTTILGMQVNDLYHSSERPAYICNIDELREDNMELLRRLFKHIGLPVTISDSAHNFKLALRMLYPFVVPDGDRVLFTHPMLIGFLARQDKLKLMNFDNRKGLVDLLGLLERIHDAKHEMQIYLDPRMDQFRGVNKKTMMDELFLIEKRMRLYKCLHQSFSESSQSRQQV
jgi:hypothetical protein